MSSQTRYFTLGVAAALTLGTPAWGGWTFTSQQRFVEATANLPGGQFDPPVTQHIDAPGYGAFNQLASATGNLNSVSASQNSVFDPAGVTIFSSVGSSRIAGRTGRSYAHLEFVVDSPSDYTLRVYATQFAQLGLVSFDLSSTTAVILNTSWPPRVAIDGGDDLVGTLQPGTYTLTLDVFLPSGQSGEHNFSGVVEMHVVPAPAAAGLLAIAGLLAPRRVRRGSVAPQPARL